MREHQRARKFASNRVETPEEMKQFLLRSLRQGRVSPAKMYRVDFIRKGSKEVIGSCDCWDEFEKAFKDALECIGESALQIDIKVTEHDVVLTAEEEENRQ